MSFSILQQIGDAQKKDAIVDIRSGDTVKVTQKIKEGEKFRLQVFEGTVINVTRKGSHTERITVRKIASGIGVEKSYLVHNPLVEKIEIVKRSKVRRNNLTYLRNRSGKSARLSAKDFDRVAVNTLSSTKEEAANASNAAETSATDTTAVTDAPAESTKDSADKSAEAPESENK
ncbi:50S ribosomal protein L19 [Candidatus Saccharibacteria bacterium]|nr:50S ribosomal protein L19 [Candidatus Saccharibacteria bacterium]